MQLGFHDHKTLLLMLSMRGTFVSYPTTTKTDSGFGKLLVGCSVQIFDLSNTVPSAAWQRELSGVGSCFARAPGKGYKDWIA